MKLELYLILAIIFLNVFAITLGWFAHSIYDSYSDSEEREYNGFYLTDRNKTDAQTYATDHDKYGNWICVNVKGMSFEDGYETCRHEIGHEIFADYCTNHLNECINITR